LSQKIQQHVDDLHDHPGAVLSGKPLAEGVPSPDKNLVQRFRNGSRYGRELRIRIGHGSHVSVSGFGTGVGFDTSFRRVRGSGRVFGRRSALQARRPERLRYERSARISEGVIRGGCGECLGVPSETNNCPAVDAKPPGPMSITPIGRT